MDKQLQTVDFGIQAEHAWHAMLRQSFGAPLDTTKFVEKMDALRSVAPQETLDWFKQYVHLNTADEMSAEEELAFQWDHSEAFGERTVNEAIVSAFMAEEEILAAKTFQDIVNLNRDRGPVFPYFTSFTEDW